MKDGTFSLTSVTESEQFQVVEISQVAPSDLKMRLSTHGLTPGSLLRLVRKGRWTPLLIEVRGGLLAISGQEASHIRVMYFN